MLAPFTAHCIELRNRSNELAATLRNALSDPEIRANAIVEADEAFQERRAKILAKLEEELSARFAAALEQAQSETVAQITEDDAAKMMTEMRESESNIRTVLKTLKSVLGLSDEAVAEFSNKLPARVTVSGRTSATSSGDGVKRPRFATITDGETSWRTITEFVMHVNKVNGKDGANYSASDVHAALVKENGADFMEKPETTLVWTIGGKDHTVKFIPKVPESKLPKAEEAPAE